jgi:hypothetical protein
MCLVVRTRHFPDREQEEDMNRILGAFLIFVVLPGVTRAAETERFKLEELLTLERFEIANRAVLNIPGYYGLGGTKRGGKTVVHVFVDRRLVLENRLPPMPDLRGLTADMTVERVPINEIMATAAVPVGNSTSNTAGCMRGTIGITARTSNETGYLTNNHVAAAEEDRLCPNVGNKKTQVYPATAEDAACKGGAAIGRLLGWKIIEWFGQLNNVDAAFVAKRGDGVDPKNRCGIDWDGTTILPKDLVNTTIQKCGAATGKTMGDVTDPSVLLWVRYKCGLRALFAQQIGVMKTDFSHPGDSGAPAFTLDAKAKVVGLLFAGEKDWTFINPIGAVLDQLTETMNTKVELCPPPCS